jgi:predicted RNase H-like HicB family nuclease
MVWIRAVDQYGERKRSMVSQIECSIECSRAPDGRWVAMVDDLPGLQLFGDSQEETLATARKVSAMLLYEDSN